jgi:hypothetical protein
VADARAASVYVETAGTTAASTAQEASAYIEVAGEFVESTAAFASVYVEVAFEVPPPPTDPTIVGDRLGCAKTYTVVLGNRRGQAICDLRISTVEWSRTKNQASLASITVDTSELCCECASLTTPWAHSVTIYRDGEKVWGPGVVNNVFTEDSEIRIEAFDASHWLSARLPHMNMAFSQTVALETIASDLIKDAMRPDNPLDIQPFVIAASGLTGARSYTKDRGYTYDHLVSLSEAGLSWTVGLDNSILLFKDNSLPSLPLLLVTDDLGGQFQSAQLGGEFASRAVVFGASGVEGEAGGVDPVFGLVERYTEDTSITTDYSANVAASSQVEPTPPAVGRATGGAALSPTIPIHINKLIPGVGIPVSLRIGCREITGILRLSALHAVWAEGFEAISADVGEVSLGTEILTLPGLLNNLARRIRRLEAQ